MSTKEDFTKLLGVLVAKFGFSEDQLHEHITELIVPNPRTEIARIIRHDEENRIGISFHVSLVPTDAIQVYLAAKEAYPKLELFTIYYQSTQGGLFTGVDAQTVREQELENKYFEAFTNNEQLQEAEAAQLQVADKKGKITFH